MRSVLLVMAMGAGLVSASAAQPTNDQLSAAWVEWALANCGVENVPPTTAGMAAMIVNGSDQDVMAEARNLLRERMTATFETRDAACADFQQHMEQ